MHPKIHGFRNRKLRKFDEKTILTNKLFFVSIFHWFFWDFALHLGGLSEVWGTIWLSKTGPWTSKIRFSIKLRFLKDLGRVLEGSCEGLGRVLGGFWEALGICFFLRGERSEPHRAKRGGVGGFWEGFGRFWENFGRYGRFEKLSSFFFAVFCCFLLLLLFLVAFCCSLLLFVAFCCFFCFLPFRCFCCLLLLWLFFLDFAACLA